MRITFILPYAGLSGGIRVLAIYAERLRKRGHSITVISLPPPKRRLVSKIKSFVLGRGWPKAPSREASFFDSLPVDHRVLEVERGVQDSDVPDGDVVLATYWKTGPSVAALSPSKGAKAILLQGYETSPGRWERAIDAVWRLPLHKIVISKWLVDLARERFNDTWVHHVPNSVDTELFFAPARGRGRSPTVGILYSTPHLKGVDVALAALSEARRRLPNLRVVAFGAEHVDSRLPLPERSQFHYRPPQHLLRELYSQCDVWLCASRQEGFHLPPLEAMACRCPVVSTRVGGPVDTIVDGVNGYLVDIEDWVGLGERLVRVLTASDSEWRGMSKAALATALSYTWDDATTLLETALREIAMSSPAVPSVTFK